MAYNYYNHEQWPPLNPYVNVSTMRKVDSQPQRNNNEHVNKHSNPSPPKEARARQNYKQRPERTRNVVIGGPGTKAIFIQRSPNPNPRTKGTGVFIPRNPFTNQLNHMAAFAPVVVPAWLLQVRNMNVHGRIEHTQWPKTDHQLTSPPKQDEEEKKEDDIADLLRELCLPEEWPY